MATNILWGAVGPVMHLLTLELNAQPSGTLTALGPEINNSGGYQMGQLYIHLASAAFVDPSIISVYLIPSSDLAGGTYPSVATGAQADLANYLAATVYIHGSTAAQDETFPYITIPPGKFKAAIVTSGSCPTLGATGNTVDLYPTPTQY